MSKKRVLSLQSHVVHGYVGNKCATFPLQVLGFEVDAINSVQFSAHTGYKVLKGQVLEEKDVADLIEGLEGNDLLRHYSHLLTGYIGHASVLKQVPALVRKLKQLNPNLIYVCDPVMGDDGHMYVPKELLPIYREEIMPLADIVTPNQFELELLTECKISSPAEVWRAVDWLHKLNVGTVAISSCEFANNGHLHTYLSRGAHQRYTLELAKQGGGIAFTGTGDLFAALFLAHSFECMEPALPLENTIATLQAVIARTILQMPDEVRSGKRTVLPHERELQLIQSKSDIERPLPVFKAQLVHD